MKTFVILDDNNEPVCTLESNDPGVVIPENCIDISDHQDREYIKQNVKEFKVKGKKIEKIKN